MDVEKLMWCSCQKSGLKLIAPNDNLALEYIKSSEETLSILQDIKDKSNMWLATTKYYCEYFSVYVLLQKIGIRCEIHDCTIEICKILEETGIIKQGFSRILEEDKELRVDNQYYLKNISVNLNMTDIQEFVLYFKDKINTITYEEIEKARKELKNILK